MHLFDLALPNFSTLLGPHHFMFTIPIFAYRSSCLQPLPLQFFCPIINYSPWTTTSYQHCAPKFAATPKHLLDNAQDTQTQWNSFQPHLPLLFYNTNICLIFPFPPNPLRYLQSHSTPLRSSNSETLALYAFAHVFPLSHPPQPLPPLPDCKTSENDHYISCLFHHSARQKQRLPNTHIQTKLTDNEREISRSQALLNKEMGCEVLHIQRGHYKEVSHLIYIYWASFTCSEVSCSSLIICVLNHCSIIWQKYLKLYSWIFF